MLAYSVSSLCPIIPNFAEPVSLAEVLLLHFPTWMELLDIKKIIKNHLVLKDDVLHT